MSKAIKFEYEGQQYELTFTKKTVKELEQAGFSPRKIEDMPMTMIPLLFFGAFRAKHPFVKKEVVDAIYKLMPDKQGLVEALGELYDDPHEDLIAEPEDSEKKVEWKMES